MKRTGTKAVKLKSAELGEVQTVRVRSSGALIGHSVAMAFLDRAAATDRLAHAYLFVGPEHVGKRCAALALAAKLLGTPDPEGHADFALLERERDAKTGRLHGTIVIDQVRALIGRLALGSFLGGYKVCVIDGAHLMTPDAANSLLKTLEEPRSRTIVILTALAETSVMPTIRSRCQVIRFERVPVAEVQSGLETRAMVPADAALFARLSGGLPGVALALSVDGAALTEMRSIRAALLAMSEQPVAERWAEVARLLPPRLPFQEAIDRARTVTDLAAELVHDALLVTVDRTDSIAHADAAPQIAAWARRAGKAGLAAVGERITETRELLAANVAPRTALERLTLSL
jgi:DNA polymerase III subunit delta'